MTLFLLLLPKGVLQGFRYPVAFKSLLAGSCTVVLFWGGFTLQVHWVKLGFVGTATYISSLFFMHTLEQSERKFFIELLFKTIPSKVRSFIAR